jgi:2,6-dihydroxypseudooxynicotine hydrolase
MNALARTDVRALGRRLKAAHGEFRAHHAFSFCPIGGTVDNARAGHRSDARTGKEKALSDPRLHHARNWEARFTVNGVAPSDFHDVLSSIDSWDDWCRAWSERARVHEDLGREALEGRHFVSAAEHLARASVTYHFAKYLFVQDMLQMRTAHMKAVECLDLALPHLNPPGERVMIPYESKQLAATLRRPWNVKRPPIVVMTMGLDSTKEELLTFETTFLERGMAILAFDGPGQGEAEYDFPIRHDYENVVGPVIDWLKANVRDVDADRIGLWGISLGGYYAPRTVAFEKRVKAAIANCGPYNWGALWEKLPDLTRAAYVRRSHSANDGEARQKAFRLSLEGLGPRIKCPIFIIAAGLDRLCPPEDAKRLAGEIGANAELLVVEDGNHVAHNRFYKYRGRSADWMARQLGA